MVLRTRAKEEQKTSRYKQEFGLATKVHGKHTNSAANLVSSYSLTKVGASSTGILLCADVMRKRQTMCQPMQH